MEKRPVKRKSRNPSIRQPAVSESKKEAAMTMIFACCPTCFNFLRIPATSDNGAEQTVVFEESKR